MPELPEVETVRRGLQERIVGLSITGVTDVHPRAVAGASGRRFGALVRGARFEAIDRHGKFLLVHLSNQRTVIAHLRMSGKFLLADNGTRTFPYTRACFHLSDGSRLCFADVRTLGNMRVAPTEQLGADPSLRVLGVDALSPDFTLDYFHTRARKSTQQLKVFLLNQSHVAGIGNIYASEICYLAGLSPFRRACRLTRHQRAAVYQATLTELNEAVTHGGTTFDVNSPNLYLDSAGRPGTHAGHLRVYQREGQPCRSCASPIRRKVQHQRSTFHCPTCQK